MFQIGNKEGKWAITRLWAHVSSDQLMTLGLRLILITFLFHVEDTDALRIFIPILIVPGILFEKVVYHKGYWFLLALLLSYIYLWRDLLDYVPNHKHIYAYTAIAVYLALWLRKSVSLLDGMRIQSKMIIGFCFLFATIGKFLAPEFLQGFFFEFTNATDERFFGFSHYVAGLDMAALHENLNNLNILKDGGESDASFALNTNRNLWFMGIGLSYWTIFIEGMIALSFCLPSGNWISRNRDIFLMLFIVTTYPIATVPGFALLLAALGFFQSLSNKENPLNWTSAFYILAFIMVPFFSIPFSRFFGAFL